MRGAPIHPDEYDGEHLNTDEKLREAGWAAGLDVWEQVSKAYGDQLSSGTLANAQLWSLREAICAEVRTEIIAAHEALGWNCSAASEGLTCCIDQLRTEGEGSG
jgi:hypothetical protein